MAKHYEIVFEEKSNEVLGYIIKYYYVMLIAFIDKVYCGTDNLWRRIT